jgi:hypothetical protein
MAASLKDYDSWIDIYPITPPVGGVFIWGAKGKVKKTGTGRVDDIVTLSEHLGRTQAEASDKANREVQTWIEAHRIS